MPLKGRLEARPHNHHCWSFVGQASSLPFRAVQVDLWDLKLVATIGEEHCDEPFSSISALRGQIAMDPASSIPAS